MRRFLRLSLAAALVGALAAAPAAASASSGSHSYDLVFGDANVGIAASGDTIHVTCEANEGLCGTFSVHPKSIEASGEFEHLTPSGELFAMGTWTATELISFHDYGCGEVLGEPLPPEFCGGAVKFAAMFSTPLGELEGIITVFCIVGPKAPSSHNTPPGEGVTVVVPGIINFNHTVHGNNVFVQTG